MLLRGSASSEGASNIAELKTLSGWCIEEKRKRKRITQKQLATEVGIAVRWLREIEAGNPKSSIEDHLRCASSLGMPSGYLTIPMMFMEHRMSFPRELLMEDLARLEAHCIACIAEYSIGNLSRRLRPSSNASCGNRI